MPATNTDHVRVEPVARLRVELAGKPIAETTRGFVVHEGGLPDRFYVPRADVTAKITDGTGAGTCPWKGQWKHLSVEADGNTVANGAWTYYETTAVCEPIRDKIAFYESKFQITRG